MGIRRVCGRSHDFFLSMNSVRDDPEKIMSGDSDEGDDVQEPHFLNTFLSCLSATFSM